MKPTKTDTDFSDIVVTTQSIEDLTMSAASVNSEKAGIVKRIGAALIDCAAAGILLGLPLVGEIAAVGYLLLRDGLDIKFMKGKSIGKTLMRIEPVRRNGKKMDIATSIKRNLPFAVGPAIMLMPFLGLLFGPIIAIAIAVLEIALVFTDADGRRIGDKIGGTKVVNK